MDLFYMFLIILVVLIILALLGYIVFRERSHVAEILKLLGITDSDGNPVPQTATAALAVGTLSEAMPGPAGPQGEPGKDAVLPAGCIVVSPDAPNFAAIMQLLPAGSAGVTVTA